MPTRLHALVAPAAPDRSRKTRHCWGPPAEFNDGIEPRLMPWARVLVLEGDDDGAMLYRYGGEDLRTFCGDTWGDDVAQAKDQAAWEYEELLGDWQEVPPEVDDATAYAIAHALRAER